MNDGLARFNELPSVVAEDALYACFASRRWAGAVAAGRPYPSIAAALERAEVAWADIADVEWLAAFDAHPRIGERGGHAPMTSQREQSGVSAAPSEILAELAKENREYEKRFRHVFLIAARGRTAAEILAELRRRMANDAATELSVAAEEQRKITRFRMQDLLR